MIYEDTRQGQQNLGKKYLKGVNDMSHLLLTSFVSTKGIRFKPKLGNRLANPSLLKTALGESNTTKMFPTVQVNRDPRRGITPESKNLTAMKLTIVQH